MTDKQIIIDYKNICENYSPKIGCTGTFDGSCIKEQCFTYKLLQKLQAKEQECEELRGVIRKDICSHYVLGECSQKHHNNCVGRNQCIKDLEQQLDQLKEQLEAYKMEAEEGKEINAELKAELEQYKDLSEHNGRVCNERLDKIDELEHDINELKAENDELKKCYKNNSALLDFEETNTTKLVNKVMKLEKTLTEIKEIAKGIAKSKYDSYPYGGDVETWEAQRAKQILQKISEVEDEN